jgi:hypothetical protein
LADEVGCCLQLVPLLGSYDPDDRPRESFLLPMLRNAVAYDRSAGYFTSGSLKVAAVGLEPFIERGGRIRLVVNHQLADADVDAIERGLELRAAVAASVAKVGFGTAEGDEGDPMALALLCTLVAVGQLDVRVAVPTGPKGPLRAGESSKIHHAKFGVFSDACDPPCQVAFEGSNNESVSGWLSNYETYSTAPSWRPDLWEWNGRKIVDRFARHWDGPPPSGWDVVELPVAARDGLIAKADLDLARKALEAQGREDEIDAVVSRILAARGEDTGPVDPTADLADLLGAPHARSGVGIATSTVTPWLHQHDVARKVVSAWPTSRMFSDEVGLGKTIEVGLVLRELLVSGKARSMLLLVPAAVQGQWQTELWEKFTLPVPSLEGPVVRWPEGSVPAGTEKRPYTGSRWDAAPVMLASSHLARRAEHRRALTERSWDVVVVDEAHHARRRGLKAGRDDPNALLALLRRMRDAGSWKGLLLATATPMQMAAHEAYDLLALLGLPGRPDDADVADVSWANAGADGFVRYYEQLNVEQPHQRDWKLLKQMAASHFAASPGHDPNLVAAMREELSRRDVRAIEGFATSISDRKYRQMEPEALEWLDVWLREHTPMRTLVHRNTRHLLRAYDHAGLLPADTVIPRRHVRELHVEFDPVEGELYERIETWIRDSYSAVQVAAAQGDKKAKAAGFIMTVYRRRLTSSFAAIEASLLKRRDRLKADQGGLLDLAGLLSDDDRTVADSAADELEGLEELLDEHAEDDPTKVVGDALGAVTDEIDTLEQFIADLAGRPGYDSKLAKLVDSLRDELGHPKADGTPRQAIVFTQFTDTMDDLRNELASLWPGQVCCYSGRGGELHQTGGTWKSITKGDLKTWFAEGRFRLLLGTDAMSEGLNLQTCDLLYNLDLPWNFMRVEQRIGRIDRIGGHPIVYIKNLLIDGTVEERIYSGIAEDFGNFEHVVGAAQPVLAQTEQAIRDAAMHTGPDQHDLLAARAQALIDQAADAMRAPVNLDTFQASARPERQVDAWSPADPLPGESEPWLDTLRETLTTHTVVGDRFTHLGDSLWTYADTTGGIWTVTFDRDIADASGGRFGLFVWGHPAFPDQV